MKKLTKKLSVVLCGVFVVSCVLHILEKFNFNLEVSASNDAYYSISLENLDNSTHRSAPSSQPAQITVLTHGYGGEPEDLSNNNNDFEFSYNANSIIEQVKSSLGEDNVQLVKVKLDNNLKRNSNDTNNANNKPKIYYKSKAILSSDIADNNTYSNIGSSELRGMYHSYNRTNELILQFENEDERKLEFIHYNICNITNGKYKIKGIDGDQDEEYVRDSLFTSEDLQNFNKHIILLFDSIDPYESNDFVYAELEYILDSVSYQYKQLTNELPTYNLIGHSRGGITNMQYALAHPNNVSKIFSVGTPYQGSAFGQNFGENKKIFLSLARIQQKHDYGEDGIDYHPGVLDIIDSSIYNSYANFWNSNYSYYDHISFNPIGSYVSFGFVLEALVEVIAVATGSENPSPFLSDLASVIDVLVSVGGFLPGNALAVRFGLILVGQVLDIIDKYLLESKSDWVDVISGVCLMPVLNYTHIGSYFPVSAFYYTDDLFINLDSQIAIQYNGANRRVKLMDYLDQIEGRKFKSQNAIGIAHNIEAQHPEIVRYIVSNLSFANATVKPYLYTPLSSTTCRLTKINNTSEMIDGNGCLTIPEQIEDKYTVTEIENLGLYSNSSITKVIIPSTVYSIGRDAFAGLPNLTTVEFESGSELESIGYNAFANCSLLSNINLPNSLLSISDGAFLNCTNLTSISLGQNVRTISSLAFLNSGIASYDISSDNLNYATQDGVLFNKAKNELVSYPSKKNNRSYTVPSTVTKIGVSAFANPDIESLDLSNVTTINHNAFSLCPKLLEITGAKVNSADVHSFLGTPWYEANANKVFFHIGKVLFKYNGEDESVDLSEYVNISGYAFVNESEDGYTENQTVKTVVLGHMLQRLNINLFANCTALENIYLISISPSKIASSAILGDSASTMIHISKKYEGDYSFENQYSIISTTVTFIVDGVQLGTEIAYNGDYFAPDTSEMTADLIIQDHYHISWYNAEDSDETFYGKIYYGLESPFSLYGREAPDVYTINYHDQYGGSLSGLCSNPPITHTYGTETVLPDNVMHDSRVFLGWYTDMNCTGSPIDSLSPYDYVDDIDLYARWEGMVPSLIIIDPNTIGRTEVNQEVVIELDHIRVSISRGAIYSSQIRIYKDKEMVVCANEDLVITKIIMRTVNTTSDSLSSYGEGTVTHDGEDSFIWEGMHTSITFTASKQVRITYMEIHLDYWDNH